MNVGPSQEMARTRSTVHWMMSLGLAFTTFSKRAKVSPSTGLSRARSIAMR
ncbi:MAG: hypothetical protein IPJ34_11255 [Myxococcales bacterium]|nr:hypothetical protein [Myxococcales bacterium]